MISDEYKKILETLNGQTNFGKRKKIPKYLEGIIHHYRPSSILDFGCGTGELVKTLREKYPEIEVQGYDPGNEKYSNKFEGRKFDLLISTDVLEHIEPKFLDQTLEFLKSKSDRFYHLISMAPSTTFLPDGRNAHLILQDKFWWKNKFIRLNFDIIFENHMYHQKKDRTVNKYFISGNIR